MSYIPGVTSTQITCDRTGCGRGYLVTNFHTAGTIRKAAAQLGWTHRADPSRSVVLDFCKDCAPIGILRLPRMR